MCLDLSGEAGLTKKTMPKMTVRAPSSAKSHFHLQGDNSLKALLQWPEEGGMADTQAQSDSLMPALLLISDRLDGYHRRAVRTPMTMQAHTAFGVSNITPPIKLHRSIGYGLTLLPILCLQIERRTHSISISLALLSALDAVRHFLQCAHVCVQGALAYPRMPRSPSIIISPAAMGAPMTCESAVLVATMARAGPVSSAEWNTVMCTHIPGKVPASTMPRNSLCNSQSAVSAHYSATSKRGVCSDLGKPCPLKENDTKTQIKHTTNLVMMVRVTKACQASAAHVQFPSFLSSGCALKLGMPYPGNSLSTSIAMTEVCR